MQPAMRESWADYRQRMLDETARFIEWGLKHPELIIEIPSKPALQGSFPATIAQWFWNTVLTSKPTSTMRRWRDVLIRRQKVRQ